jgi:hypothetical protein
MGMSRKLACRLAIWLGHGVDRERHWRSQWHPSSLFGAAFFLFSWGGRQVGVCRWDGWAFGAFLAGEFFLGGAFVVFVAVEPFVDGLAHGCSGLRGAASECGAGNAAVRANRDYTPNVGGSRSGEKADELAWG